MKETDSMVVWTAAKIRRMRKLNAALREWYRIEKESFSKRGTYHDWMCRRIVSAADSIDKSLRNVCNLAIVLQVDAVGDATANKVVKKAAKEGFVADVYCLVEEGNVYITITLEGKDAESTVKKCEEIAAKFGKKGYGTEISKDALADSVYYLNMDISFTRYLELVA